MACGTLAATGYSLFDFDLTRTIDFSIHIILQTASILSPTVIRRIHHWPASADLGHGQVLGWSHARSDVFPRHPAI